ncbi:CPBP family intramembrane glutamic endopeptidase [Campylobacter ureolyticus]|uniref:Membrane protein n=2 Tax=Campylobacter ureolyticus TaxID=827 RepID=A0AAE7E9C9_9BACT|nr:CPBP family intramembrane glutamic endopeptidase [Campylobacter ureolyticus]MCR8685541.1 CPBP family glutamic-type intramembrane protease [Campylobacter ureolyticus]QKF84005.1 putative membrane protein [Campylobacter ureolyticus]QQY35847.1 CPBP family intramembrane metalloprotease [Campylobacter ureolyticus]SUX24266.1 CAAX amino terminal protease self- immunity [Campylobacter ureolyticus]
MKKVFLYIEFLIIFLLTPTLFMLQILPKNYMFFVLWLGSLYAFYHIKKANLNLFKGFKFDEFKDIFKRFLILSIFLTIFTFIFSKNSFLFLPKQRIDIWILVMLLYPILSAFFQEIIFRTFFTLRYINLFKNQNLFIFINALIFAFVHLLYGNLIAVVFSFFGGILFIKTYLKSNSTLLCSIEHSLYGNFIFTIGLGHYFYNGY